MAFELKSVESEDVWVFHELKELYIFTCKTETLGSLYSHALLILTESSSIDSNWIVQVHISSGMWIED